MEVAKVKARIYGEDGCEDIDFIVDPNSLETVVPHELAEKIGISMPWEKEFKTPTGERFKRKVGDAEVEVDGIKFLVFVVAGDTPALGFDALESGRFKLNSEGKLIRVKRRERRQVRESGL